MTILFSYSKCVVPIVCLCIHWHLCVVLDSLFCPFCLPTFVCLLSSLKSTSTSIAHKTQQIHRFSYRLLAQHSGGRRIPLHLHASSSPHAHNHALLGCSYLGAHVYLNSSLSYTKQSEGKNDNSI